MLKTNKVTKEEDDDYKTSMTNYYNIAHSKQEQITEQASIMVNGKLKEYQVGSSSHMFKLASFAKWKHLYNSKHV